MEHRWGERVAVNLPIRVSAHAFAVRGGRMTDLSVSGAYIEANLDLRLLSRIEISIVLPRRSNHETPAVPAYVARKYRHGIGIEWCEFAPAAVSLLLRTATQRRYSHAHRPHPGAAQILPRTSGSLLKHSS